MSSPSQNSDDSPQQPPFEKIERVDLAICTFDRAGLLEQTLESIQRLVVPYHVSLNVILVDNGSTDRTSEVLEGFAADESFADRHSVSLLEESRQGHTFARNCAIQSLDGDLLIWTDDDVQLDAFLVEKYVEFADSHPDTAFFGGKIEADFESEPPDWVTENWDKLSGCFAARDLGDESVAFNENTLPYGANFAVRSAVQSHFQFDTELGRRGDEVLGEDELEMMRRLLEAGYQGLWVPESIVKHFIPSDRITESYVRNYFLGQGRALVAKGQPWSDNSKSLMWRSLRAYLAYRFKRRFAASEVWISLLMEHALAQGQSEELKRRTDEGNA